MAVFTVILIYFTIISKRIFIMYNTLNCTNIVPDVFIVAYYIVMNNQLILKKNSSDMGKGVTFSR